MGRGRGIAAAAVCHAGMIALLAVLPLVYNRFGPIYWAGVAAVAVLLVYEHRLVRPDDLTRVNRAFFNVNAVVSIGLLLIGVVDLFIAEARPSDPWRISWPLTTGYLCPTS